jgi:hypothetical protein
MSIEPGDDWSADWAAVWTEWKTPHKCRRIGQIWTESRQTAGGKDNWTRPALFVVPLYSSGLKKGVVRVAL